MSTVDPDTTVETGVPDIPEPRPDNLLEVTRAIREILQVREGRVGDPLDQAVTYRELYLGGNLFMSPLSGEIVIRLPGNGDVSFLPPPDSTAAPDFAPPPAVTNLQATGAVANVILTWDQPSYHNHAYTEVWRSATDDLGTAVRVGTTASSVYADNLGQTGLTRYYWARNVSTADVAGPFNATAGTSATTGLIGTGDVADGSITTVKIADLAVDSAKIADLAVATAKIADLAVTAAKIQDATITTAKIGLLQVTTALINDLAVTTGKIDNLAVTAAKIANATITNAQIANATITATQIASATITAAQIANATITNAQIANATITGGNIAASTIAASNMIAGTITAASAILADAVITTAKIADLNVSTLKIADQAVTIPTSSYTAAEVTVTADTQVQSVGITSSGASIFVNGQARVHNTDTGPQDATLTLKRDGTSLMTGKASLAAGEYATVTAQNRDTPGSGAHTYTLHVTASSGSNLAAGERVMLALETKK